MAFITLGSVTIPVPGPYNDKDPLRQQENLAYVQLQICQQLQATGFRIPDAQEVTRLVEELQTLNTKLDALKTAVEGISLSVSPTDLTDLIEAIDGLTYRSQVSDMGFVQIHPYGQIKDTI